ncbi:MAG: hypothetical protein JWP27_1194 [Flaviaesturariibacter sp.]|nr:hypothetical protein [Flaviaesturariibacter sp.]
MRKSLLFAALASAAMLSIFSSCKKEAKAPIPETYKVESTAPPANVTTSLKLTHNLTFDGGGQYGQLTGSVNWTGLAAAPDTVKFLIGGKSPRTMLIVTKGELTNNSYTFTNAVNGGIAINMPFITDVTSSIAAGDMYMVIGKSPNYTRVNLDKITRQ